MILPLQEIFSTTWSAAQAAISVMLVLGYGYYARKLKILSRPGEENSSHLCVTLFLPCLLFAEIGPLSSWSNLKHYWVIIVYSLLFQFISWMVGLLGVALFKFPKWIVPCMIFNNATSLPVLLLKSLGENGTLDSLVGSGSLDAAMKRGRVYILINALVCNLTRFTFGPRMLDGKSINLLHPWSESEQYPEYSEAHPHDNADHPSTESSPLLARAENDIRMAPKAARRMFKQLDAFMNPPMYGGAAAIVTGVIPFLHKWFYGDQGALSSFTRSVENLGNLYPALQMFVLGAHLRSKNGPRPPIFALFYLYAFRFFIMPVISSSIVWGVRRTIGSKIIQDPILDFVMIVSPVGPPALTLAAIVAMSDAGEDTSAVVAKTLVISYILTPLISITVTAAISIVKTLY
ncbi:endoplasmic reticulum protein [Cryptococcus deuterogattii 2001/935-1]|nr:endoplasmic reticulum protein [Cryptococcus deuterogattii 2001/935-1]